MNFFILAVLFGVLLIIMFKQKKTKDNNPEFMIQENGRILNKILVEEKQIFPIFTREVLYFIDIEFQINEASYWQRFSLENAPQLGIGEKVKVFKRNEQEWQLTRS
ncbi:hypothetical protein ACOMCU_22355 [Lysinibacillus sp. UGB7]|uniref:hypothetical protein n=1 Tax=Lysinibacillus sp. UGB7 TaxID=3411039 RepID=UPI003B7FA96C